MAIKNLPPFLLKLGTDGSTTKKVQFFKYTGLAHDVLQLGGGTGDLTFFLSSYRSLVKKFGYAPMRYPIIIMNDNDDGAKGIYNFLKTSFGITSNIASANALYHLCFNLYLVKTPSSKSDGTSCIEDFFDNSVLSTKLDGKTFNSADKIDATKEYGKVVFAEKVVRPNAKDIDFSQFAGILDRIVAVIDHYKAPTTTAP